MLVAPVSVENSVEQCSRFSLLERDLGDEFGERDGLSSKEEEPVCGRGAIFGGGNGESRGVGFVMEGCGLGSM